MAVVACCLLNQVQQYPSQPWAALTLVLAPRLRFEVRLRRDPPIALGLGAVEGDDLRRALARLDPEVGVAILFGPGKVDVVSGPDPLEPPPLDIGEMLDQTQQTRARGRKRPLLLGFRETFGLEQNRGSVVIEEGLEQLLLRALERRFCSGHRLDPSGLPKQFGARAGRRHDNKRRLRWGHTPAPKARSKRNARFRPSA